MKYQMTVAQAFTYRGWYCSIQEALGGYRVDAVAMTRQFQSEYYSNPGFKYAKEMKHCGTFRTFKVYQLFVGYGRAIKKAKSHIDECIGDAPIY